MGTDEQGHRSRSEGTSAGHTFSSILSSSFSQLGGGCCYHPRRQRWLSWAWLQGHGCGRHLGTGLGERAGVVGRGEGLCEAGEDTVVSSPQASGSHLLSLKLGILGFPHWPLQRVTQD